MSTIAVPASTSTSAREAKRLQLEAAGLTPPEVERTLTVLYGSQVRTVAAAVDAALPELKRDKPGTYKTYAP